MELAEEDPSFPSSKIWVQLRSVPAAYPPGGSARSLLPLKPVEMLLPIQDEGLGIVRHLQAEGVD